MDENLIKKYIPMTETTYYTLLAVTDKRHGYAIMQYVSDLTKGRIQLGTGTLYTMVGRLTTDGIIEIAPNEEGKKSDYGNRNAALKNGNRTFGETA